MSNKLLFVGNIVSAKSIKELNVLCGFLCVEGGNIVKIGDEEEFVEDDWITHEIIHLGPNQFLMPGFIDCHTHAPQFPNIGLGLDRPLLEWLDTYTFPLENKYADAQFAAKVYDKVVNRLLINGTTTACYFGSLHLNSTLELAKSAMRQHQRAFVGKASMNIRNHAGYYNDTETELREVEAFVKAVLDYESDLVQPIVTPRSALTCDKELMIGLSKIATKYRCQTQTHISENQKGTEKVLKINQECTSYSDVYDKSSIFENKCILAHAVHLSDSEISLLVSKGATVAHCPASNTRLKSGLCPVIKLLNRGLTVGLGTDVSGGDKVTILDAMRRTMDVSTHLQLLGQAEQAVDWRGAFYFATLGGAKALSIDNKVGNFEVGKNFDALVIDVFAEGQIDDYGYSIAKTEEDHLETLLQEFIYLGDDRNISQVYVDGKKVKDITTKPKSFTYNIRDRASFSK